MIKNKIIQPILSAMGYYKTKAKIKRYFYLRRLRREDSARNAQFREQILKIDRRLLPEVENGQNLTVSLTSHGKRVADFVPYAIWSILQQTKLPNRIVLNIDETKWNNENLPELIKKLQVAGLEVNFCEDLGPHTKLLPALQKYPNDVIVTIDDDIIYEHDAIANLWEEYIVSDKKTVICRSGRVVCRDGDNNYLPYSKWKSTKDYKDGEIISPYGVSGVLYPPHIFSKEIFNKSIFRKYCKGADDIWFTIMEIKEGIQVVCISTGIWYGVPIDRVNEFSENYSDALHFTNDGLRKNDEQLKNLVDLYL